MEAKNWSFLEIDLPGYLPPIASSMWQKEMFLIGHKQNWLQHKEQWMELVSIRDKASSQREAL